MACFFEDKFFFLTYRAGSLGSLLQNFRDTAAFRTLCAVGMAVFQKTEDGNSYYILALPAGGRAVMKLEKRLLLLTDIFSYLCLDISGKSRKDTV